MGELSYTAKRITELARLVEALRKEAHEQDLSGNAGAEPWYAVGEAQHTVQSTLNRVVVDADLVDIEAASYWLDAATTAPLGVGEMALMPLVDAFIARLKDDQRDLPPGPATAEEAFAPSRPVPES